MALPEASNQSEKKSPESHKNSEKKEKLPTKVVIRRLPPNMDQETFLNQVSPVPNYDYIYMVKGDASLGENAFARVYINFTNSNDIFDFKEKFDNYVFLDSGGHEYPAVVEFAAFQKIPKKRNKIRIDHKSGTVESDPCYLEFVEMLNKPLEPDEKPEYSYQITTENKSDSTTPLLEYVKNKRAERLRIREERREERKRKEFERKKYRDDERKKRYDDRSPIKPNIKPQFSKISPKEKIVEAEAEKHDRDDNEKFDVVSEDKPEKYDRSSSSSYYKNRERKYDDRKKDLRPNKYPPKKEYVDKREYKSRRDDYKERDYRTKYDDYKKDTDTKLQQKKVKKYSEKREERRIEAQKAEQKKLEQKEVETVKTDVDSKAGSSKVADSQSNEEPKNEVIISKKNREDDNKEQTDKEGRAEKYDKSKESDVAQKRIRNKDRPTIAIYRPGMLSRRKQTDGDLENKELKKD